MPLCLNVLLVFIYSQIEAELRRAAACIHEISIFLFISDHFLSGFSELTRVTSCDRCRFPSLSQTSSACCRVTVPRCSWNPFDFKLVLTPNHNKVNRVPALLIAHTLVTVTILWSVFLFHKMKKLSFKAEGMFCNRTAPVQRKSDTLEKGGCEGGLRLPVVACVITLLTCKLYAVSKCGCLTLSVTSPHMSPHLYVSGSWEAQLCWVCCRSQCNTAGKGRWGYPGRLCVCACLLGLFLLLFVALILVLSILKLYSHQLVFVIW